ncbi:MAG: hypothetical protein WDA21_00480 [Bacilli bacterium]
MIDLEGLKEISNNLDRLEGSTMPIDLAQEDRYYSEAEKAYIESQSIPSNELLTRTTINVDKRYLQALTIFTIHCMKNEEAARQMIKQ